ncbi:MAG TPA: excinuclease ATPase subunit [Verrucomicrobiae bacterium]|nr:excinuclease ATPase subunit [Verrucomicrobiae bacterium]
MTPFARGIGAPALIAAALSTLSAPAEARDDRLLFDIQNVLNSALGKDRFDETVEFYWGDRIYPQPQESFGVHTTERRTFAPIRTDPEACDRAFIEALAALRDAAKAAGANAVVEIKSIYKNREFRSETQYECRAGYVVTGVSLEGRLVKLPGPGPSSSF